MFLWMFEEVWQSHVICDSIGLYELYVPFK